MKKRLLAIGLCFVLLSVFLPTASAVRQADGMSNEDYAFFVGDGGVVELVIAPDGFGGYEYKVRDGASGNLMDLNAFWDAFVEGADGIEPGYEGAITFKITNTVSGYAGVNISMSTYQVNLTKELDGVTYTFEIPLNTNQTDHPKDDRGNTGTDLAPLRPPSDFPSDVQGWVKDKGDDLYKLYPANLLDKFQFEVFAALDDAGAFRDTAGNPKTPQNILSLRKMIGWMTSWKTSSAAQQVSYNVPFGSTLYIHYTFFWDGTHLNNSSVRKSLVAPSVSILDLYDADSSFVQKIGDNYYIHDNYYMGSRAAFRWRVDLVPYEPDRTQTAPPQPVAPPPGETIETPPTGQNPITEPPYTIEPPITDSPGPIASPPSDVDVTVVSPLEPGMPWTGGANIGNLFFLGLFFLGIGLIFLKSRKKRGTAR